VADGGLGGILGLAFRAGQMTPGAEMSLKLIRDGKAALLLYDPGASALTIKKLLDAARHRDVPAYALKEGTLGESCGRPGMAAAAMKSGPLSARAETMLRPARAGEEGSKIVEDKG